MVEYNSSGLVQFFGIIKKAYAYLLTTGKDFLLWIWEKIKTTYLKVKGVLCDYFMKDSKELSKDQLKIQIEWTHKILVIISTLIAIHVLRVGVYLA